MFATDPHLKAAATLSHNQTMVVEREREKGKDISHIPGLSAKQTARIISVREFNIFSRAGQDL
jgi:predicted DNA-binding helix-hairpin-helix protein